MYLWSIIRLIAYKKSLLDSIRNSTLVCALISLALISTLWSVSQAVTFRNAIELIGTAAIAYYIVARFELSTFVRICSPFFLVLAAIGIVVQSIDGEGLGVAWAGVLSDKNAYGSAMALGSLTFLSAVIGAPGWRKALWSAGLFACLCFVALSTSVTAMAILAVTIALTGFTSACRKCAFPPSAVVALILSVAALVSFALYAGLDVQGLIQSTGKDATLTGRTDIWPVLFDAIGQQPILGYGYNGYFAPHGPADVLQRLAGWRPYHSHNSFIQMTLSLGFVGLSLLIVTLLLAYWRSIIFAVRGGGASIWPFSILTYLMLASITETYIGIQNTVETILLIAAIVYSSRFLKRQSKPSESQQLTVAYIATSR
jgi:O-antigen ligase